MFANVVQPIESDPNSRLILKGATNTDKAAKDLTYKRLDQFGIDTKNVEWLPLTPTPREHLLQYSAMDIALDTFLILVAQRHAKLSGWGYLSLLLGDHDTLSQ